MWGIDLRACLLLKDTRVDVLILGVNYPRPTLRLWMGCSA